VIVVPREWLDPPKEFSQAPFWFWNDELSEPELVRQMEDFRAHGVHGFVIHPRAGLPRDIAWLGERMIGFMRFAIEQAAQREMWVILSVFVNVVVAPTLPKRFGVSPPKRIRDNLPRNRAST